MAKAAVAPRLDEALQRLRGGESSHVKDLQELISIPSVGADPAYARDVRRAADWLVRRLRRAGLENVGLVETSGHPTVVADWLHAGPAAPTLLVYGHYDVQPAKKEDGWTHDPFDPRLVDGRVRGRGAMDDKGQFLCHVLAAEAWIEEGGPPVNLRLVLEGEEESASLHFDEVIRRVPERLRADALVVSDMPMRGERRPSIVQGLRGLVYAQVDVQGPATDLHSGVWGGVICNPVEALSHMLASCKDPPTGKVLVAGFYDDVVEPTAAERASMRDHGEDDEALREGAGVPALSGEEGWSGQERIGVRPTFDINGVWGGYQGAGPKTVIPATAHAKVSCRLVADQDPAKLFAALERHLLAHAPTGVGATVTLLDAGHPVRADLGHPYVQALGRALEAAFGAPAVPLPEGGSIPAVAQLQRALGAVPLMAGFGHRDENMHAPDESFRLDSFRRGKEAAARLLAEAAAVGRP